MDWSAVSLKELTVQKIARMWFMAYAQPVESDETDIHIYEFGNEQPIEAKKYLYNKTWRCWNTQPSKEDMEARPWKWIM